MKPLIEMARITAATAMTMVLGFAGATLFTPPSAGSQTEGQAQVMPEGQMPMMGPEHGRWMWPHRGGRMRQGRDCCIGSGTGSWMGRGASMVRHMFYMHNGIPPAYHGKFSSLAATPEVVRDGAALYSENCASCHGRSGFGDGEAALRRLRPTSPT